MSKESKHHDPKYANRLAKTLKIVKTLFKNINLNLWEYDKWLKDIQDKKSVAYFWLFLQLIFRLTLLTSAAKSNEKLVNQKLCNTVLILDAL